MKTIIVVASLMAVALALPAPPAHLAAPPQVGGKPIHAEKDDLKTDETVYLASAYAGYPAYTSYSAYSGAALPAYAAYGAYGAIPAALPAIQPIAPAPIAYYR